MSASTESTDRLEVWRELIREHFVALDVDACRREPFTGTVATAELGHLRVSAVDSRSAEYRRTAPLVQRAGDAYLQVGLVRQGEAVLRQDGREALVRPGQFALYETDRPFFWGFSGDFQLFVFTWPRASIALEQPESQRLTAHALGGPDGRRGAHDRTGDGLDGANGNGSNGLGSSGLGGIGLGSIVGRMLCDIVTDPPSLSPAGATRLAHEIGELVTTVASENGASAEQDMAAGAELRRIEAYIAERLADPALSPEVIARAHYVSTRQLHRVFAQHGDSVTSYIRKQRLERCCRELASRRSTASISEIGRRWGFLDATTFSRAFRAAYGTTPGAYRRWHAHNDR